VLYLSSTDLKFLDVNLDVSKCTPTTTKQLRLYPLLLRELYNEHGHCVTKALKLETYKKAIAVYWGYDTVSRGDIQGRLRNVL